MITFRKRYFIPTVFILLVEILIAIFVRDKIVRPYIGDFLVVILIYCFVRTFVKTTVLKAAAGALIFAYVVEILQYLDLTVRLGLQKSRLANIILGNSFEWIDIAAYTLGIATVITFEKVRTLKGKGLRTTQACQKPGCG